MHGYHGENPKCANYGLCHKIVAFLVIKLQARYFQILHFDCMRFGQDELAFLKPEENGGLEMGGGEGEGENGGEEAMGLEDQMVVYDHVEDNKKGNKTKPET